MVARQLEMSRINAFPNARGTRSIVATLPDALVGFQPTRTNKTPSATARINALINFLYKQTTGSELDASPTVVRIHRLQFRGLTRDVRLQMKKEGANATEWSGLSPEEQVYYSLQLEGVIAEYGFPIYKCNKRWAANLLLQECMKGERQTKKRRMVIIIILPAFLTSINNLYICILESCCCC
ncbi:hypothetical protein BD770DRAFT_403889 [Pilaira anomala]|nr:hypothetical protein BD770DRAFT_403889 [Pilaira anomala]